MVTDLWLYGVTESLIKRKLLCDGDGTGEDKRLQTFIRNVTKWIHTEETPQQCQMSYNNLTAQLGAIRLNKKKFNLTSRCNAKQLAQYQALQATLGEKIREAKADIVNQKKLLEQAKLMKTNRMDYNLLAQSLKAEPDRVEVKRRIEQMGRELKELEVEKEKMGKELNFKVKQCHVLSTSANAIKTSLEKQGNSLNQDVTMDGIGGVK